MCRIYKTSLRYVPLCVFSARKHHNKISRMCHIYKTTFRYVPLCAFSVLQHRNKISRMCHIYKTSFQHAASCVCLAWKGHRNISCIYYTDKASLVYVELYVYSVLKYHKNISRMCDIWAATRENLPSGFCEQHRRRPACASEQSDQRLCYSHFGKYHIKACYKRNFNFVASPCS